MLWMHEEVACGGCMTEVARGGCRKRWLVVDA